MKMVVRLVGILVIGLAAGGVVAALAIGGILPVPFGPLAEARAAQEKARPPVTVMYPTKERIVNLTDTNSPRYLKAQITLEFIDVKLKEPPKGEELKKQQEEFAVEMSAYSAVVEDKLVTILSSKSSPELLTPAGKEKLRVELIDKLNAAFHDAEKVVNVYFNTFIIQ